MAGGGAAEASASTLMLRARPPTAHASAATPTHSSTDHRFAPEASYRSQCRLSVTNHLVRNCPTYARNPARRVASAASTQSPRPRHRTGNRAAGRRAQARMRMREGSKGPVPSTRRRTKPRLDGAQPQRGSGRMRAWSSRPLRTSPPAPSRLAARLRLGKIDPDRLDLGVEVQTASPQLPPEPRFLEAAERQSRIEEGCTR